MHLTQGNRCLQELPPNRNTKFTAHGFIRGNTIWWDYRNRFSGFKPLKRFLVCWFFLYPRLKSWAAQIHEGLSTSLTYPAPAGLTVSRLTFDVWHLNFGIWHFYFAAPIAIISRPCGANCFTFDVCRLTFDISSLTFHIWNFSLLIAIDIQPN